jgi:vacuolar protein sorting-associated protein 35
MKRALESGNLKEGIQYADVMLAELKNPYITPKNYYILFMDIFNYLGILEESCVERKKTGRKMVELYETVQQAEGLLQRLYLMATVACAYIDSKEAVAKEVITDLVEMAKGLQQPIKGLFFRYYLLKKLKGRFPDKESAFEGEGGTVNDCIGFLLENLAEMNRLWIRMQYAGSKDKAQRESDRNDVNMLVGENVTRLSNLRGIDLNIYKTVVQPRLFDIIHKCKDPISQQYLMDSVIQVFTDEFHLNTLENLLEACTSLHNSVDIKSILISLMDRLSNYTTLQTEEVKRVDKQVNIFLLFKKYIDKILEDQGLTIGLKKLIEMEVAFLRLSLKTYPRNIDYVNQILEMCIKILQLQSAKSITEDCIQSVVKLLVILLESLSIEIFNLSYFNSLVQYLTPPMLKTLAKKVIMTVVNHRHSIESLGQVQRIIVFLKSLFENTTPEKEIQSDPYEFEETHTYLAKFIHLIDCKDPMIHFQAISAMQKTFEKSGIKRLLYITPAVVNAIYRLVQRLSEEKKMLKNHIEEVKELGGTPSGPIESRLFVVKVFQFVYQAIDGITQTYSELAIRLFLQGVLAMNGVVTAGSDAEETGYQFASQALVVYQDELANTEAKYKTITLIIGALQQATFFSSDNYETLITNAAQYCAKLLKRQDQCKALLMCTHMFHSNVIVLLL